MFTIMVCLGACAPEHSSYSEFKQVPVNGWYSTMPIRFAPEWADSTLTYDVELAIRHNNKYSYRNLSLTADLISDTKQVKRGNAEFAVADDHGNWLGSGFGSLYQCKTTIARGVSVHDASRIVVWLSMKNCSFVTNVTDLGVIITPSH